jgi:hypothetical protein
MLQEKDKQSTQNIQPSNKEDKQSPQRTRPSQKQDNKLPQIMTRSAATDNSNGSEYSGCTGFKPSRIQTTQFKPRMI